MFSAVLASEVPGKQNSIYTARLWVKNLPGLSGDFLSFEIHLSSVSCLCSSPLLVMTNLGLPLVWVFQVSIPNFKLLVLGCLGDSVVKRLPSAQVMIPGSWDRAPHRAPCSAGSLLLPLPLPLLVLPPSPCLSLSNK